MNQAINGCLVGLNSIGKAFCGYAAGAFVQSALLVLLLFGMDLLLRKRVRAVFRYCVWLLVLVKLVLPPTLCLPSGIGYWVGKHLPAASPVSQPFSDAIGYEPARQHRYAGPEPSGGIPQVQPPSNMAQTDAPVTTVAPGLTPITWQAVVFLLWLVGVLAFALLLAQRLRFVKGLVAASTPAGGDLLGLLEQCRRQIGVRRQVGLRTLDAVPSPAVCGLWKPTILMPTSLVERLSPEGLRAALIHELAHIKRADLWINAVQTFLQVVYFYNPFVWFANAIIRRTCEEAVDETVLVTLGGEAKSYSNTLIDIGEMAFWKADFGLRLIGVAESRKALQWRIKHMLTRPIPKSARIGALGMIMILVVAAVLLPMARAERPSKDAPAAPPVAGAGASEKAPPAGESDTIVDPKTGLRFTVAQRIGGEDDETIMSERPSLSPNGKFLLSWGTVVPLDGSPPFELEALRATGGHWSPDGKLIAYQSGSAIWLLPVAPETGRPTGPARKLADDGARRMLYAMAWTGDDQQIRLYYSDLGGYVQYPTCLSVQDGKPVPSPEHPRSGMDYTRFGLRSPDGRWVAFSRHLYQGSVWVASSTGGPPKFVARLTPPDVPLWWSPDGQWLLCSPNSYVRGSEFVRLADGFVFNFEAPESVGRELGLSPDGKRLLFWRNSYTWRSVIKTVAVRGGAPVELKMPRQFGHINAGSLGCRDGKRWCFVGQNDQGKALMVVPVAGGEPVEVKISGSLSSGYPTLVSPDGKRFLSVVGTRIKTGEYLEEAYVVGISLERGETTGEPVLVFKFRDWGFPSGRVAAWSPDSTRLIISPNAYGYTKGDLWVVPADGSAPRQLTHSPDECRDHPTWSPDGQTIAYTVDSLAKITLYTVPSDGGTPTPRAVWTRSTSRATRPYAWFPNSKEIAVLSDDGIMAVSVEDGKIRPFLKLADAGFERLFWFDWSPDGQTLGLNGDKHRKSDNIALLHASDGKIEKLPTDPLWDMDDFCWTPDSQTIGYIGREPQRVRPAGVIYGLDVEEALQRAVAGAPPVQDKPPGAALDLTAPPLVNGEYTDHFDGPLAPCWKVVERENQPTHVHEVRNGELVLENGAAILGGYDWTNYVFKARMCVKPPMSPYGTLPGVVFRRNANGAYWLDVSPCYPALHFGVLYGAPANERPANAATAAAYAVPDLAFDTWYTIEVEVKGSQIKASVDGKLAFEVDDATFPQGAVELRAEGCRVHFDDFSVRLLP